MTTPVQRDWQPTYRYGVSKNEKRALMSATGKPASAPSPMAYNTLPLMHRMRAVVTPIIFLAICQLTNNRIYYKSFLLSIC